MRTFVSDQFFKGWDEEAGREFVAMVLDTRDRRSTSEQAWACHALVRKRKAEEG